MLAGDGADASAAVPHTKGCTTSNVGALLAGMGLRQASAGSLYFTAGSGVQHDGMFALSHVLKSATGSGKQVVCPVLHCILACQQTPPVGSGRLQVEPGGLQSRSWAGLRELGGCRCAAPAAAAWHLPASEEGPLAPASTPSAQVDPATAFPDAVADGPDDFPA